MTSDRDVFVENAGQSYRVMTLVDFREFRDLALSTDPRWSIQYSDKILVESRPSIDGSNKLNTIRAKAIMERVPPVVLYNQLHDATYRAVWDTNMLEGYNITKLNAHNDIGYYAAKFPWPLKNRDFCNMRSWMEFTNGEYIIFNHSVRHSRCPERKHFVRANSILSGYYIRPYKDGTGTELIYLTYSDPRGSIPHAIINLFMSKGAPMLLNKCEKSSEAYPDFVAKTYPPGYRFPWTTPKMDWSSELLYPEDDAAVMRTASEPAAQAPDVEPLLEDELSNINKTSTPLSPEHSNIIDPMLAISPASVVPNSKSEPISFQQYRELMGDAINIVDQYFLTEKRLPTTRDYILRVAYIVDGLRKIAKVV